MKRDRPILFFALIKSNQIYLILESDHKDPWKNTDKIEAK